MHIDSHRYIHTHIEIKWRSLLNLHFLKILEKQKKISDVNGFNYFSV